VTATAEELLSRIRERGGRVHRMRDGYAVFCLTDDPEVARGLMLMGARPYRAVGDGPPHPSTPPGGYLRAKGGKIEWDLQLNTIPVEGSLWSAAG
jgi:hypothetical protein